MFRLSKIQYSAKNTLVAALSRKSSILIPFALANNSKSLAYYFTDLKSLNSLRASRMAQKRESNFLASYRLLNWDYRCLRYRQPYWIILQNLSRPSESARSTCFVQPLQGLLEGQLTGTSIWVLRHSLPYLIILLMSLYSIHFPMSICWLPFLLTNYTN
jgi:hypothetical protein